MRKYFPIRPYLQFLLRANRSQEKIVRETFAAMREELTSANQKLVEVSNRLVLSENRNEKLRDAMQNLLGIINKQGIE